MTTEIFLDSFIIFGRNIQCLQTTKLVLNKIPTICDEMEVITLLSGFEIEANGRTLTDFHLNAKRNKRLKWSKDYSFANLPSSYITVEEEDESVIVPLIDDLVLTAAGEPHIAKITALSSSFVALIIIGCCITCYKCDGYRNFFTDILKKCIPSQARRAFIKKKFKKE